MDVVGALWMPLVLCGCGWCSVDVAGAWLVLCGCDWCSVDVAEDLWMWLVFCGCGWCSVDVAGVWLVIQKDFKSGPKMIKGTKKVAQTSPK